MGKRLSDDIREEIIRLYVDERLGVSQISRRLRIGSTSALRVLDEAGVDRERDTRAWCGRPGGQRFSAVTLKEIASKYAAGATSASLQREYDCSVEPIRRALRRHKIAFRGPGISRAFSETEVSKMAQQWKDGLSLTEIGKPYGAKRDVIANALRLKGLESEARMPRGDRHVNWKGGRVVTPQGYVLVAISPTDPFSSMQVSSGYVMEHRLVMAQSLGRPLTSKESVHHINGDKSNNRLENLQLRQGRHGKHEAHRCRACGSYDIETVPIAD